MPHSSPSDPAATLDLWSSGATTMEPITPSAEGSTRAASPSRDHSPGRTATRSRTFGVLLCPESAEHGPLTVTQPSGRLYCPHQSHDLRSPAWFTLDAAEAARNTREEAHR